MSQISGSCPNTMRSILKPSTLQLVSSGDSTDTNTSSASVLKPGLLRPPVFKITDADSNETQPSAENLTPSPNPFLLNNVKDDDDPPNESDVAGDSGIGEGIEPTDTKSPEDNIKSEVSKNTDPLALLTKNGLQNSNLFTTTINPIPISDNKGFVFGQNVHERVTGDSVHADVTSNDTNSLTNETNNSGELFAIAGSQSSITDHDTPQIEASVESLTEVARVYEESRAQKRKYEEVQTFTGEEDEKNILDVNCKLFTFVASNWEERGPGSLRVNDPKNVTKNSRVVFRTRGNLRVLLNTKVWPEMVVAKPSQKSLRLTAIDSAGQIKIFLVMARPDDITNLYTELSKRIELEKSRMVSNVSSSQSSDDTSEPSLKKPAITDGGVVSDDNDD